MAAGIALVAALVCASGASAKDDDAAPAQEPKETPEPDFRVAIDLDREMAAKLGLTAAEVAAQIKAKMRSRYTKADLEKLVLRTKDGRFVWLRDVATIRFTRQPATQPAAPDPKRGRVKSQVLVQAFVDLWASISAIRAKLPGKSTLKLTEKTLGEMTDRSEAFWVTPAEERRFQAGRFDDAGNAAKLAHLSAELTRLQGQVPPVPRFFLAESKAGRLKGAGLELAVRMLAASLRQKRPPEAPAQAAPGGTLAFRIAPSPQSAAAQDGLDNEQIRHYVAILAANGPMAGRKLGDPFAWFEVRAGPEESVGLIRTDYDGHDYVLLANRPPHVLLPQPAGPEAWGLAEVYLTTDLRSGKPAIGLRFDAAGGKRVAKFTAANKGRRLAILVGEKVYAAPVIRSVISDRAVIKMGCDDQTARRLVEALRKGTQSPTAGWQDKTKHGPAPAP